MRGPVSGGLRVWACVWACEQAVCGLLRGPGPGLVDHAEIDNDNSYTYRGLDESMLEDSLNVYPTHLGTSPRYHRK